MQGNGAGSHIPEHDLEQYALGRLNTDKSVAVEQHLLICTECQDALQRLDALGGALRDAALNDASYSPASSHRKRRREEPD